MSPTAGLLATGHESGGLDGLALFGGICIFLCVAFLALMILLIISAAMRRKKPPQPPAPPSEPPTAHGVDDDRR